MKWLIIQSDKCWQSNLLYVNQLNEVTHKWYNPIIKKRHKEPFREPFNIPEIIKIDALSFSFITIHTFPVFTPNIWICDLQTLFEKLWKSSQCQIIRNRFKLIIWIAFDIIISLKNYWNSVYTAYLMAERTFPFIAERFFIRC